MQRLQVPIVVASVCARAALDFSAMSMAPDTCVELAPSPRNPATASTIHSTPYVTKGKLRHLQHTVEQLWQHLAHFLILSHTGPSISVISLAVSFCHYSAVVHDPVPVVHVAGGSYVYSSLTVLCQQLYTAASIFILRAAVLSSVTSLRSCTQL